MDLHHLFYSALISGSLIFDVKTRLTIRFALRVSSSWLRGLVASISGQYEEWKSRLSFSEDYFQAKEHVRFVS